MKLCSARHRIGYRFSRFLFHPLAFCLLHPTVFLLEPIHVTPETVTWSKSVFFARSIGFSGTACCHLSLALLKSVSILSTESYYAVSFSMYRTNQQTFSPKIFADKLWLASAESSTPFLSSHPRNVKNAKHLSYLTGMSRSVSLLNF